MIAIALRMATLPRRNVAAICEMEKVRHARNYSSECIRAPPLSPAESD